MADTATTNTQTQAAAPQAEAPEKSHDDLIASMTGGMVPASVPAFAGSSRLNADGRPLKEFRTELRKINDVRNALTTLSVIVAPIVTIALVIAIDHWLAVVAAIPVMAGWQNRWYILHHEAAHRLLFSNRRVNDRVGVNLMGWLVFGTGAHHYRRGHANHHRDEFGPKEPDFLLYAFYPIPRPSAMRKLRRDATGVSAYRIMKPRFTGLLKPKYLPLSLRFFAGQAIVFSLFLLAGAPLLYVVLWALPYVTLYQVYNRLRSLAEHGGMTRSDDRRETTHHVRQSMLARATFAPYNVGYHLAHHVDSGVPFRNLPKLHDALVEDGYATEGLVWETYPKLWKSMVLSDSAATS